MKYLSMGLEETQTMYWFGLAVLYIITHKAYGGAINCCVQHYDIGNGPKEGDGYDHTRWWYDIDEGKCLPFLYTGYGGNGNNFLTEGACMSTCAPNPHYFTGNGDGYKPPYHVVDHHEFGHDDFGHHGDDNYAEQEVHIDYYATSKWTGWSEWGPCSKTCGYGEKSRTRACFNTKNPSYVKCSGDRRSTKACDAGHCPVHGGWSDWGYWSSCSVTCGSGTMKRTRSCNNPAPSYNGRSCSGQRYRTKSCNKKRCPVDGKWSKWSKWTKCPRECEKPGERLFQTRHRVCTGRAYGGHKCKGYKTVKRRCNRNKKCKSPYILQQNSIICPNKKEPYRNYQGYVVCGDNSYNPRCPEGYGCYPVEDYTFKGKTLSVCCEQTEDFACHLPKDPGPCHFNYGNDDNPFYYYNKKTDRCEPFQYGGCLGNANRFKDAYKCQLLCVKNDPKDDICLEPKDTGDSYGEYCNHHFKVWYYDSDDKECRPMHYTGCGGNNNRFYYKLECEAKCQRPKDYRDKCELPCDYGQDSGLKEYPTEFYYNKDSDTCEKFKYKGAGGNDNRFYDYSVCEKDCKKKPPSQDDCSYDVDPGHGPEDLTYYYFDNYQQKCVSFQYRGLGGNKNRFPDIEYCENLCRNRGMGVSVCDLPKVTGDGYGKEDRYYYDKTSGDCEKFTYTGHGGNANCFKQKEDCQPLKKMCQQNTYIPYSVCELPPDSGYYSDDSDVDSGYSTMTNSKVETKPFYYYDTTTDSCKEFGYFGYGGNDNRFQSKIDCQEKCRKSKPTEDDCNLPYDEGSCKGYFLRYYYSPRHKQCYKFAYTGCSGNGNNFIKKEDCEKRCGGYKQEKTVCDLPKDSGVGDVPYLYFYFDNNDKTCKPFLYNGYHGNGNRFDDMRSCLTTCYEEDNDKTACGSNPHESSSDDAYWAFYYSKDDDDCHEFLHSREIGTKENCFPDKELCQKRCKGYKK